VASAKKVAGPKTKGSTTNGSPGKRLSISTQQNESKSSRSAGKDGKKDAAAAAASAKTSASLNEAATAKEEDTSVHQSDTDPVPCSS